MADLGESAAGGANVTAVKVSPIAVANPNAAKVLTCNIVANVKFATAVRGRLIGLAPTTRESF